MCRREQWPNSRVVAFAVRFLFDWRRTNRLRCLSLPEVPVRLRWRHGLCRGISEALIPAHKGNTARLLEPFRTWHSGSAVLLRILRNARFRRERSTARGHSGQSRRSRQSGDIQTRCSLLDQFGSALARHRFIFFDDHLLRDFPIADGLRGIFQPRGYGSSTYCTGCESLPA
jgi:hypothetical protein